LNHDRLEKVTDLQTTTASRWPHRLAVALCCATFPLVWVGGLVTTYQAGMAVPDWPSTFGYNLFLYPIETWISGPWNIFIEHGHRLFASAVGLLTIARCVAMWRTHQPRWLQAMSILALAAVIFQGVLGGVRVLLNEQTVAMIHGCFGPAFFALTAAIAAVTSRRWQHSPTVPVGSLARNSGALSTFPTDTVGLCNSLAMLAIATPMLAYLQLVLGAQLRHFNPALPHAVLRTYVVFHIVVGLALSVHIAITALSFWRKAPSARLLVTRAFTLVGLIVAQLALGAATWFVNYGPPAFLAHWNWLTSITVEAKGFWQSQITTAHVAVGSLILAISTVLAIDAVRMLKFQPFTLPQAQQLKGAAA
jgi:cytochrome c oxidase assembly protein subunit 15